MLASRNYNERQRANASAQIKLDALVLPAPGFTTVPAAIAGYPIVTGTCGPSCSPRVPPRRESEHEC